MLVDLLSNYTKHGWGYDVPKECLVITRKNYKNILRKIGGTKKLKGNIEQFFINHPRAERAIIRLDN